MKASIDSVVRKRILWGLALWVGGFFVLLLLSKVLSVFFKQILSVPVVEIAFLVLISACGLAGLALIIMGLIAIPKASKELKDACFMLFLGIIALPIGVWGTVGLFRGEYSGVVIIGFIPIPLIVIFPLVIPLGLVLVIVGVISFFKTKS